MVQDLVDPHATLYFIRYNYMHTTVHLEVQSLGTYRHNKPGADPENLHGRWLMGWLPIINLYWCKGGGWLIMVNASNTTLHMIKELVKGGG